MGVYANAYHQYTNTCVGSTIDTDGNCASCHTVKITARTSTSATNEVCASNSNVIEVTVIRSGKEILEDLGFDERPDPPPTKPAVYKPVVRAINDSWKAKWRLTQQRPRDGLR